jgi:hypothetical protein
MRLNMLSASPLSQPAPKRLARDPYAVILASGPAAGGKRATLALAAACTAQAMDLRRSCSCSAMVRTGPTTGAPSRYTRPVFRPSQT